MGKDTEPRLPQQPPPGQFPNAEFLGYPILEPQPDSCFYCFPKIDLRGKFPTALNNVCRDAKIPIASIGCARKQFLVFDQTGNKTTVMLSSWTPNLTGFGNPRAGKVGIMSKMYHNSGRMLTDESEDDRLTNEDSEEIDALLYSDKEEEEEEEGGDDDTDEVTSSFCPPLKRQKHSNGSSDYEKIRETVSILQTIIPGMNGGTNDAVVVIDEAIEYLQTLKFKAKSLGISALSMDPCGKS